MSRETRIVYTTGAGRVDPERSEPAKPATDGIVRIRRESKGRGGKAVCVITGLGLDAPALRQLAKDLKRRFGVGGAVKQWDIELQGGHRDQVKAELEKRGFTVKLAGG